MFSKTIVPIFIGSEGLPRASGLPEASTSFQGSEVSKDRGLQQASTFGAASLAKGYGTTNIGYGGNRYEKGDSNILAIN